MDVILSIKPKFANRIFSGIKKYEFRKTIFRREVNRVFLYETTPVGKITGYFRYRRILKGTPEEIWSICQKYAGISEREFFQYYSKSKLAYAIEVEEVIRFKRMMDLKESFNIMTPPQSFTYISSINHLPIRIEDFVHPKHLMQEEFFTSLDTAVVVDKIETNSYNIREVLE